MFLLAIILFIALELFLVYRLFQHNANAFFVFHLLFFIILVPGTEFLKCLFGGRRVEDFGVFLIVNILLLIYIVIFMTLYKLIAKLFPSNEYLINRILEFYKKNRAKIAIILSFYVLWKIYLLGIYGVSSFKLLSITAITKVPFYIVFCDTLLGSIALGTLILCLFYVVLDPKIKRFDPKIMVPAFLCLFTFCVFTQFGGSRRFIASILLLATVLYAGRKLKEVDKLRLLLNVKRPIFSLKLAILLLFSFSAFLVAGRYIKGVNSNLYSPYYLKLLEQSQTLGERISVLRQIITDVRPFSWERNIEERDNVFEVICFMTSEQVSNFKTTFPGVTSNVLKATIPRILWPSKPVFNNDELIVINFPVPVYYNIYSVDIASSIIGDMQAEFWFFAYLLTPFLYIVLSFIYLKILLKSYNNFVISLASISALYSLLYRIEEDITALFIDLRNFMVLFLCGLIIYIANKVLKGSIKTYAHPSRYTNL